MNQNSEVLLAALHPRLSAAIHTVYNTLMPKGIEIRAVAGFRTIAVQDELYSHGRTKLHDLLGNKLPIVTNARGGYSGHNFALAVDVIPGLLGKATWTPNWDDAKESPADLAAYMQMVTAMKSVGLLWGGDWKSIKGDFDHFYLPNAPATPTNIMRADLAHGLSYVFQSYDAGRYKPASAVV